MMDIKLVSQDRELWKACSEILTEIAPASWNITAVGPLEAVPGPDLFIWDYCANFPIPDYLLESLAKVLFLVHRDDLAAFRATTGAQEPNILLKPYTRLTLTAFLTMAVFSTPSAISLRADRDAMLQCLIQTNLRLQEYDLDRTNFLARAVHDFRAPLTAISGYCGLLLGEPLGTLNETQTEVLKRMQHSTGRLLRMASAMFQLSVGRRVKRLPGLQKGDIRVSLDQALHEIAPFADEKRIAITAQLELHEGSLYFDGGQIEQVLINILDNACKFTPKAGSIEIRGYPFFWERRTGHSPVTPLLQERRHALHGIFNGYRVDIRDSGTPIAPEHLDCIFEEYTSYSAGRDRSGGGLGLAICKSIVGQHDGRVWAQNTDTGPMISFVLPLRRSAPHLVSAVDSRQPLETCI